MKILMLSTSDMSGGAAKAAFRLHKGLQKNGISSRMMVQFKESDDHSVIGPVSNPSKAMANLRVSIDLLPLLFYRKRKEPVFHLPWLPDFLIQKIADYRPDVVHLHWICRGFMNIDTLARIKKPIVWTLHDMWPFTGGCHYCGDCEKYKNSCGACPQLGSKRESDLSRWTYRRKARLWEGLDLTLVAPSLWMKRRAQESSLFCNQRIEVVPNGIDISRFRPIDQKIAKAYLGFPHNKNLIVFGAVNATSDRRKGFQFLLPALNRFSATETGKHTELVVFGSSEPGNPSEFGLNTHYLGRLHDELTLPLVYAASDILVVPSLEDNLPNTIMEALSCGIPCIAFKVGGVSEMIEHKISGYLARPFDIEDLANGIAWVLEDKQRLEDLAVNARIKAEKDFDMKEVAHRYASVYRSTIPSIN